MIDGTGFLSLKALPQRILFVGCGSVSFEFAQIAARAEARPVIIDRGARMLKVFDPDLVLHGAGPIATLADLNLEAAGVEFGDRGIVVAAHLQSTTKSVVFVAGDFANIQRIPLTPVAVIEGKVAEPARIEMLEAKAKETGHDVDVWFTNIVGRYSNYGIGETCTAAKMSVDKSRGKILGVHLFGLGYGKLINFFGLAIKLELTAKQLNSMTTVYPKAGSILGSII